MALFKFFRAAKSYEEDIQREKACITRIKHEVSQKCGIDNFIDNDDSTVAFFRHKKQYGIIVGNHHTKV